MRQLTQADLCIALDACAAVIGNREYIVVGAVSIVGAYPEPPPGLAISNDIDLFPPPDGTGDITEAVTRHFGEGSLFALENEFHIESVGRWTLMMALEGWEERLIMVKTAGSVSGLCLSPLDLAYVKLEVARDKDIRYVGVMLRENVITREEIRAVIATRSEPTRSRVAANLDRAEHSF